MRTSRTRKILPYLLLVPFLSIFLLGCSDQVTLPSAEQLEAFKNAGPTHSDTDIDYPSETQTSGFPYRVLPGEVIELTMPAILQVVTAEETGEAGETGSYTYRINESGNINLPVVGEIEVAGKTLAEVESIVIDTYYPEYTANRPAVHARLVEQLEQPPFVVIGLVNKPGSYAYPRGIQYSVIQAIGLAGGLNLTLDPRYAMVYRLDSEKKIVSATFQIVNGPNFEDSFTTPIKPGDIIIVEHTSRTRTNEFLKGVFRINVGTYFRLEDLWEDDD